MPNKAYKARFIEAATDLYFAVQLFEFVTAVEDHLTLGTTAVAVFLDFVKIYEPNIFAINSAIGSRIDAFADAITFAWACRPCYMEIIVAEIRQTTKASESQNRSASNRHSGYCGNCC